MNWQLSCVVCRGSLVIDAVPTSFDQSYHLLTLRNRGGLMIPSEGTVKVVRSAECFIRQSTSGQAVREALIHQFVRAHTRNTQCIYMHSFVSLQP